VLAWGEDAVLGGKGGEIGEGSCPVKMDELDGPLRGRILFDEVDGAWVKKTMGMSLGFQISHSDLMAASTRPVTYLCLWTSRISFEGCERGGREEGSGFEMSESHIERAGAGVDTVDDEEDAGVCKYALDGVRIEGGIEA